ncbi:MULTISPECIES: DNA-processing protein DprA [Lascolabacillus]|uniref:DNA-processing protein DprA n=1 Tax=Lascolabacillus TaxID=1924067 RepID=UPI0005D374C0|nr:MULTISPECIES: DNA-processing protein DprA [Lascolabacillus]MDI9624963.1 DNA-processing protein DprA [Bacteroidota bacterium]MCK9501172.1 DNA-processing protein DprA [Lascolabacillus sp.]MDD2607122.1 DNA-processing protein DprA [Lascolabacillus sp.]MDD3658514.1 DNA-processing protein DprA [Lascolabacillus sp.]MDD4758776.1 DNA-processing protein DprA [Lascolabacillus sp.]
MTNKSLYQIALTQIKGVGVAHARNLMEFMGDEEEIFKGSISKLEAIPRISKRLISEIRNPEVLRKAEKELEFVIKNNLHLIFYTDEKYPQRLNNCVDAPILMYAKGDVDFNREKVISIVGTRNSTRYGNDFSREFIKELSLKFPDVQIISGLAYGIDICAHRAALENGLSTVAVLGHGLDRIYPYVHRQTAIEITKNGALLTEYPSETNPDGHNFVRRNRIVAGMADATIVMESGTKGGSLITADIANSYFREVFALPGRIHDKMSYGCNKLISENKALLLQNTENFISQMGWEMDERKILPRQTELFHDLTPDEEKVYEILKKDSPKQLNNLSIELNVPLTELLMTLLELEMKNIVTALPGGMYKIV